MIDLTKLQTQLLQTKLQTSNPALYQIINQLIKFCQQNFNSLSGDVTTISTSGVIGKDGKNGPPGYDGLDGDDGLSIPGPMGLPGATGPAGPSGSTGAAGSPGVTILAEDGVNGEDGLFFLKIQDPSPAGAEVYRATNLTLSDATPTAITFSSEVVDDGNYWDAGDPTKITITEPGWYSVTGQITIDAQQGGILSTSIYVNGTKRNTQTIPLAIGNTNIEACSTSSLVKLSAGDYIQLYGEITMDTPGNTEDVQGGNHNTFIQVVKIAASGGGSNSADWWDDEVIKTSNEGVTNSTTLIEDAMLYTPALQVSSSYIVEYIIIYSSNAAAGDYKYEFRFGGNLNNASEWFGFENYHTTANTLTVAAHQGGNSGNDAYYPFGSLSLGGDSAGGNYKITLHGWFVLHTPSSFAGDGTLHYRFALAAAAVGRTCTTYAGSRFRYKKLN